MRNTLIVTIDIEKSIHHGYFRGPDGQDIKPLTFFEHLGVEEPMECQYLSTSSTEYFPRWSLLICRRVLPENVFTNRPTPQAVAEPEYP